MSSENATLPSNAERRAEKAESLAAFSGLKLLHIRRQISQLLALIGRGGIFEEYTRHDISHVDAMLKSLDWIIPESTKSKMSPADWLMTVLAVYFHDLGMLVTKDEYASRNESGFPLFKEQVLFAGPEGQDYQSKVSRLGPEAAERFLYQEFVRYKHAERSRAWVIGQVKNLNGAAVAIVEEVGKLLTPLGPLFRRDLGLICESHHLNDLGDIKKYKPRQAYGDSAEETANVHYCAILLRTADLLHVTSDRTPAIAFRVISPTDPISQQEWAKQLAVTSVRPKLGLNADGFPDDKAQKDTIEVYAYFTKEDGFFGLTSYLVYVAEQLKKSREWAVAAAQQAGTPHEFNWRKIDDTNIETEGFIRDTFEFSIDQAKVLDLLTGHTLYNDTKVVLRELAQNSLDAIRLQCFPSRPTNSGRIHITWDSKERILSVQDNGTGMSQSIINNYLLKVGSSRYQDPEFKKKYPDFSSISRFGIGVLSAFMIADSIEILTCHPEDEQARQITLRSVHGKYLIRLIDKSDARIGAIFPHGTIFRLAVRHKVKIDDMAELAKHWLVVPDCSVTVSVDGGPAAVIGAKTVRLALISLLQEHGFLVDERNDTSEPEIPAGSRILRVVEKSRDGLSLAFVIEWNAYFKQWSFVKGPRDASDQSELSKVYTKLATCVEGVRVESGCPGMRALGILALANVTGQKAPKTNVARSGLEATEERDEMLRSVYAAYGQHVVDELAAMHNTRGFSLTWAAQEAKWMFDALPRSSEHLVNKDIFDASHRELPLHLVEVNQRREIWSAKRLSALKRIWTIDCSLLRSAEFLIREIKSEASISALVQALGITGFGSPGDAVLCVSGWRSRPDESALREREVGRIIINRDERRVDLEWVGKASELRWKSSELFGLVGWASRGGGGGYLRPRLHVPLASIPVEAPAGFSAAKVFGDIFLLPGNPITDAIRPAFEKLIIRERFADDLESTGTVVVLLQALTHREAIRDPHDFVTATLRRFDMETSGITSDASMRAADAIDTDKLAAIIAEKGDVFDSSVWTRAG